VAVDVDGVDIIGVEIETAVVVTDLLPCP